MSFQTTLDHHFPNAVLESIFVTRSSDWLEQMGFSAENSIVSLGRCRDELTLPLLDALKTRWGTIFDLTSLAGMVTAGKTGFSAAIAHAPTGFEHKRYLFFAFSHIGVDDVGQLGNFLRNGQAAPSPTCGALTALQQELQQGTPELIMDRHDIEQSLLRQRLAPLVEPQHLDFVALTKLATEAISADMQTMIDLTVDSNQDDYALLTGVQIHAPQQQNLIWLANAKATVRGVTHSFSTAD
jgi:hypothetical protein